MYGLRNSELRTCLFQYSHKTRQTMLLYAFFTPKVDFKRKFNHHQSFLYEWRLTARTIRKFRIGPSIRIESRIGCTIRNRIESRSFAGPYCRGTCRTIRAAVLLLTYIWQWRSIISVLVDRSILISDAPRVVWVRLVDWIKFGQSGLVAYGITGHVADGFTG